MQIIKLIFFSIFAITSAKALAEVDCDSNALNRDQELVCEHTKEIKQSIFAKQLYKFLRNKLSPTHQTLLDKNYAVWAKKSETDCILQRDAFNNWGKDYVPDSAFQYQGCRINVIDQQISFYKGLICPESFETNEQPDCEELKLALKGKSK